MTNKKGSNRKGSRDEQEISRILNKIRNKEYRRFRRTRSWFGGEGRNGT